MAHVNTVLRSVNAPGATLCVDLFRRPDGSFGFEEFRRDPEDVRGWYAVGHYSGAVFPSQVAAWDAAQAQVAWLAEIIAERPDPEKTKGAE
ncbi:hypothetical protein SAMN05421759_10450 [Roseivivax lentus]|uniref:Uncharacterized protein n=1 Tax=Roseivivax lentus TaxID=633194 RepID=A0A1N7M7E6_9RHOB|nr:hypothetical protein [Roseivivax lentus]SIS82008.1 hypothetical protein SAMN05421759_10450 [Roseivivax lentus]